MARQAARQAARQVARQAARQVARQAAVHRLATHMKSKGVHHKKLGESTMMLVLLRKQMHHLEERNRDQYIIVVSAKSGPMVGSAATSSVNIMSVKNISDRDG